MKTQKEDKQIQKFNKEASPILSEASALTITNEQDKELATTLLSRMNKFIDSIEDEEEKITKPLNEALKVERARWKPFKDAFKPVIESVRSKLSQYQTQMMAKAEKDKDAIAARIGDGKGKFSVETGVRKIAEVTQPQQKTTTSDGSLAFRPMQKLKVVDETKVPRQYLVLNETLALADLKAGKTISGLEIEIIQVPVNKR